MRTTYANDARETRSLTDVFTDAVVLVRQDAAEYGFTAVLGAIAGSVAVVMLGTVGGPIAPALSAPAAFLIALLTYATACAAIRRVEEQLSPDTLSAFAAVCARGTAIIAPALGPLGATFVAVLAASLLDGYIGSTLATLLALAAVAAAAVPIFQRALYVPALFARASNAWEASARAAEATRAAGPALGVLLAAALVPAGLFGLIALGTGFNVMSTALATFVFVMTMPLCAAIATLVFDQVAPANQAARPAAAVKRRDEDSPVADRLTRIRR